MFSKTALSIGLSMAFGTLIAAAPAQAQTQRIEITGSNVKRIVVETSSPMTVISREDIRSSGAASVRELLEILPSSSVGSLSPYALAGFNELFSNLDSLPLGASPSTHYGQAIGTSTSVTIR